MITNIVATIKAKGWGVFQPKPPAALTLLVRHYDSMCGKLPTEPKCDARAPTMTLQVRRGVGDGAGDGEVPSYATIIFVGGAGRGAGLLGSNYFC